MPSVGTQHHSAGLIFFLILLPAVLTWFHLSYILQKQDIILVEEIKSLVASNNSRSAVVGLYWNTGSNSRRGQLGTSYLQQPTLGRKWWGLLPSWPSISQVACRLIPRGPPSSSAAGHYRLTNHGQTYCLVGPGQTLCPVLDDPVTTNMALLDNSPLPVIALWKRTSPNRGSAKKDAAISNMDDGDAVLLRIRRISWFTPYYFETRDTPLQQIFQRPATCLLWAVNIGLALTYWNYRVSPSAVALLDGPILQQYQYWRAFTGSCAHFEWWHLAFNMMSLHNLGRFLEPQIFGSINFLLFNLALIPVTVLIFFVGTHLLYMVRIHRHNAANNGYNNNASNNFLTITTSNASVPRPSVNAVGYSGMLFAWMVVTALEQPRSCPIPFLENLCFDTWNLTSNIKFNFGPMVQLIFAQIVLPRVSLGGHLAGVVAGFLLHWNLLPLEFVQPSVLVPIVTLVQWKVRQFIPIHRHGVTSASSGTGRFLLDAAGFDDVEEVDGNNSANNNRHGHGGGPSRLLGVLTGHCTCLSHRNNPQDKDVLGMSSLLSGVRFFMLGLAGASILLVNPWSSILYSFILVTVLFHYCYHAYVDYWDDQGEQDQWSPSSSQKKRRMLVLWKGFVVSSVLVIIMDAMTLSCWLMMGNALVAESIGSPCALLILRLTAQSVALCLACKHLGDIEGDIDERGIFEYLFGFCVVNNAKSVGESLLGLWLATSWCRRGRFFVSSSPYSPTQSTEERPGPAGDNARSKALAAAAQRSRAAAESEIV